MSDLGTAIQNYVVSLIILGIIGGLIGGIAISFAIPFLWHIAAAHISFH